MYELKRHTGLRALQSKVPFITVTEMYPTGFYSPVPWPADIARYEDNAKSSANRILARAQKSALDLGVSCDTVHIADERPADGILKARQEQACVPVISRDGDPRKKWIADSPSWKSGTEGRGPEFSASPADPLSLK